MKVTIKAIANGLEVQIGELVSRLIPVTDEIIRCVASKKEIQEQTESLMIEKKENAPVEFTVEELETEVKNSESTGYCRQNDRNSYMASS